MKIMNKYDKERILEQRSLYNSAMAADAFYLYQTIRPIQNKYYHLHYRYIMRSIEFDKKLQEYRKKKYDQPKYKQLKLF